MVPTAEMVESSLAAIAAAGGDVTQPTSIVDQLGYTVAVVSKQDGQTSVFVPDAPTYSVTGVVQSVTGWIDSVAGTITDIGAEIQRAGNAVRGGAAGASAGWNAPLTWTPYLLGAVAVLALVVATSGRRRS